MIQFNLLPDVKLQYIKTRRTKRLVTTISLLSAAVAITMLAVLFLSVQVVQKKHLQDLSNDINGEVAKLKQTENLDKILTIQNQLASLPDLHSKKTVTSRLLNYIQQVTPASPAVYISKLELDFSTNTLVITGSSDTFATANRYADTLKFASFKTATKEDGKPFSDVVTTLTKDESKSSFTITTIIDPLLFAYTESPTLTVPNIISTRSVTESPASVFKAAEPLKTKTGTGAR